MAKSNSGTKKFAPKVRQKCLLWCARHCCLCGKNCRLDIEIHHLEDALPVGKLNGIDNAIPVCYQCHADLERSKANSPRGSKYIIEELKARREQIYEEHTRHLVPVLYYGPTKDLPFPQVQFFIQNTDGSRPVYAKCRVEIYVDGKLLGTPIRHYAGDKCWACNPGLTGVGWFDLSSGNLKKAPDYKGPSPTDPQVQQVRLRVYMTIIDSLDRGHHRLPAEWYYNRDKKGWTYDP